jgi:uncharacterized protein DUF4342
MDNQEKSHKEEFTISADDVVAKFRELINEGNVRRVIIKNEQGRTLLEVPLTTGGAVAAAAVIFAPVLAAIGALAALAVKLTIVIERAGEPQNPETRPMAPRQPDDTQPHE